MGRSTEFYRNNEEGREKRLKYQRAYNKRADVRKRRNKTKRDRRKMIRLGHDVDGKDVAHTPNGLRVKSRSTNRGSKSDQPGDRRARATGRKRKK